MAETNVQTKPEVAKTPVKKQPVTKAENTKKNTLTDAPTEVVLKTTHEKTLSKNAKLKDEIKELKATIKSQDEALKAVLKSNKDLETVTDMANKESMTMSEQIHIYKKITEDAITLMYNTLAVSQGTLDLAKSNVDTLVRKLSAGGINNG